MKVSFEGMGEKVVTFEAETSGSGAVAPGGVVTMSGYGKVKACTSTSETPVGVALSLREDLAAVQIAGYAVLPCAAGLAVGWQAVAADSSGKLTAASTGGRPVLVTDVADGMCGVIL